MLGTSGNQLNQNIARCLMHIKPNSILEYGCGKGKLGIIIQALKMQLQLNAVQKLFMPDDRQNLEAIGYNKIYDEDIKEFVTRGIFDPYDVIVASDVIEHFMYSDAISILDYSLFCCKYFILVWPSRSGSAPTTNQFDIHRTSFELRQIVDRFDVVYYTYANDGPTSKYQIAVLKGHCNTDSTDPFY